MGKYTAFAWVASFLMLRGLMLFDTPYDWIVLISGGALLFSIDDPADTIALERTWCWIKRQKNGGT